jgi:tetratricopeptide (TPR) repeat protein
LNKLIIDYPKGFYINDALKLILILDETENQKDVIDSYTDAMFYKHRNISDSTELFLKKIADNESKVLADLAVYSLAKLNFQNDDSNKSIDYLEMFFISYPESYYIPFGMKLKADILSQSDNGREEANVIYRKIIELYPDYPFIMEIRKRISSSIGNKNPA